MENKRRLRIARFELNDIQPIQLRDGMLRAKLEEHEARSGEWIEGLRSWDVSGLLPETDDLFGQLGEEIELSMVAEDGRVFTGTALLTNVNQASAVLQGSGPLDGVIKAEEYE